MHSHKPPRCPIRIQNCWQQLNPPDSKLAGRLHHERIKQKLDEIIFVHASETYMCNASTTLSCPSYGQFLAYYQAFQMTSSLIHVPKLQSNHSDNLKKGHIFSTLGCHGEDFEENSHLPSLQSCHQSVVGLHHSLHLKIP